MADSDTLCQASELMEKQLQLISEMDGLYYQLNLTSTLHRLNCEKAAERRDIEFRDEDFAINSLTKHQASMTPILDTYNSVSKETSAVVTKLLKTNHPDAEMIKKRDAELIKKMNNLKQADELTQKRLVAAVQFHEYERECVQIFTWIKNVKSESFGQSYRHLETHLAKFQGLKSRIQAIEDRFNACINLAEKEEHLLGLYYVASMNLVKNSRIRLTNEWRSLIEAVQKAERKLKLMTEDAEICENCDKTFKKSKPLRLHTRQDHENEDDKAGYKANDEKSINENKTIEGEPDQQHEDSGLDGNNDKEHKDQSCRSENGENEKKDSENKDGEKQNEDGENGHQKGFENNEKTRNLVSEERTCLLVVQKRLTKRLTMFTPREV